MTVKIQFFSAEQMRAFVHVTNRFDESISTTDIGFLNDALFIKASQRQGDGA